MSARYLETLSSEDVLAAQAHYYGSSRRVISDVERDAFSSSEVEFIEKRDSFYMATINAEGWPYLQHRGGEPGFLKIQDEHTLAFADFRGNRQLISTGNLAAHDRVALFLMDYSNRSRLKILGHAKVLDAREHGDLATQLTAGSENPTASNAIKVERIFLIDVLSFDWNCPQYITPRFTAEEVQDFVSPLKKRIEDLEALVRRQASE